MDAQHNKTNDLESFRNIFEGVKPWSGYVPKGFIVDFLGALIDIEFNSMWFTVPGLNPAVFNPDFNPENFGGQHKDTVLPQIADVPFPEAEAWFEAVDWLTSAREARDRYVMISLGANYGAQLVSAYRALQMINPLPYKLVAVEPVPGNLDWIKRHMRNNGINPDQQWIVPLAISDTIAPLFFPIGAPGFGANNCYSTNEPAARAQYAREFISQGMAATAEALHNLLVYNTTGMKKDLLPGHNVMAEINLVSSITLNELLGPFDMVDYLESDIQQSEILVFPPFIELLRRKVRRIHIGTHGEDVHTALHNFFAEKGWDVVFSYKPNSKHESALGNFETNDGVLTVRNPDL
jgi:hypothetical protein